MFETRPTSVPLRALVISFAALAVPLYGSFFSPAAAADYQILLWLLALVPAFLLAYYRGWPGAAFALAVGMTVLAVSQAVVVLSGRRIENWPLFLMVVAVYIGVALAVGWVSELLHREREDAQRLALTDELTGLPNRRHAVAVLEREFAAARRGRPLAVVLFDLDHFKKYNDRHGHAAGDEALRAFGSVLLTTTRQMNLSARHGGEEFLTILSETNVEGALAFVDRVRAGLRATPLPAGECTVSAGVAVYARGIQSPDDLVAAADQALYRAKGSGRDRVCVYEEAAQEAGEGRRG